VTATVLLLALALSTAATAVQARRDEARSADLLIVVAPAVPPEALVKRSFDLYRRGFADRIVVVGAGGEGLRAALQAQGLPESAAIAVLPPGDETEQLMTTARQARADGAASAVVAGDGAAMLRWLKLAGDAGLRAYGAPTPNESASPLELVEAGARYWRYVLLRR
jgi:hypothetical protein